MDLGRKQKREDREREVTVKPRFGIGSVVQFETNKAAPESWVVIRYQKIQGQWEVLFRSLAKGSERSVLCSQLALHV